VKIFNVGTILILIQALFINHACASRAEIGAQYFSLTKNQDSWSAVYFRGANDFDQKYSLHYELINADRFNERGTYINIGGSIMLSNNTYVTASVGKGDGTFFWPSSNAEINFNRKFLSDLSLIGTLGAGYYKAPDGHLDKVLLISSTWYAPKNWLAELGLRLNSSNPGSINSSGVYTALTHGEQGRRFSSIKFQSGTEAYQLTGDNTAIANFHSSSILLTHREWLTKKCGVTVFFEHYKNFSYERNGGETGFFCDY
jgi:YaiO family outer membrane protein